MANEVRPCIRSGHAIGDLSNASNDSHQCVGRYGCTTANCGTLSDTSLDTTRIATAAIAPMACSVSVEMASPIAPSPAIAAATKSVTNSTRSSPVASETVVPDSSVTGPTGKRATPVIRAAAVTTAVAHKPNTAIATYLIIRSLVRPAGTV